MGTHPIFESDFDCLTDLQRIHYDQGQGQRTSRKVQGRTHEAIERAQARAQQLARGQSVWLWSCFQVGSNLHCPKDDRARPHRHQPDAKSRNQKAVSGQKIQADRLAAKEDSRSPTSIEQTPGGSQDFQAAEYGATLQTAKVRAQGLSMSLITEFNRI